MRNLQKMLKKYGKNYVPIFQAFGYKCNKMFMEIFERIYEDLLKKYENISEKFWRICGVT